MYWRGSAQRAGLTADGTVLKRVVALASLFRAGSEAEMADLLKRVPDLRDTPIGRRLRFARWLRDLYPPEPGRYAGALQPDLVAERHVVDQLANSSDLAAACWSDLDELHALEGLTVLARACNHQPQAQQIISAALQADLSRLGQPAIRVAIQTGGKLGDLLAQALKTAPAAPDLLGRIAAAMPHPTTALARANLAVIGRIVYDLPSDTGPVDRAYWESRLSAAMRQVGRSKDALSPARKAVGLYIEFLPANRSVHLPRLAEAATLLANCMSDAGEPPGEALQVCLESVELWREAAEMNRDRYLPSLANALTNSGFAYYWAAQPANAVRPARESVSLWREVVQAKPATHAIDLARALGNLGQWLFKLHEFGEAEARSREALRLSREAAQVDPDRYLPDLGNMSAVLGKGLLEAGRPDDALRYVREATEIHWQLKIAYPELYRYRLAWDLLNSADCLTELGENALAAKSYQKAITVQRELEAAEKGRYCGWLAKTLIGLAISFDRIADTEQVSHVLEEAASFIRDIKQQPRYNQYISEIAEYFFAYFKPSYDTLNLSPQARAAFDQVRDHRTEH